MGYILDTYVDYLSACNIINKLKKSGIEANIIPGGVGIFPKDVTQIKLMKRIIEENNLSIRTGYTRHEAEFLYGAKNK